MPPVYRMIPVRLLGVRGLATRQVRHLVYSCERPNTRPPTSSAVLVNLEPPSLITEGTPANRVRSATASGSVGAEHFLAAGQRQGRTLTFTAGIQNSGGRLGKSVTVNRVQRLWTYLPHNDRLTDRWIPAIGNTVYGYDKGGNLTKDNYAASADISFEYNELSGNELLGQLPGLHLRQRRAVEDREREGEWRIIPVERAIRV